MFPSVGVVLCSRRCIAQYLVGGLDFLEANDELGFASRVSVWVVLQRQRPEGLADLVFAGVGGDL
jgi:hypothetical protein